jgi:hypothetical protein
MAGVQFGGSSLTCPCVYLDCPWELQCAAKAAKHYLPGVLLKNLYKLKIGQVPSSKDGILWKPIIYLVY